MAATASPRTCPWQQGAAPRDIICTAPEPSLLQASQIRKSYPWKGSSDQLWGSWHGSLLAQGGLRERCQGEQSSDAEAEDPAEHKVHGGMPRTISMPAMASPASSPDDRRTTALGDSASAPAVPTCGVTAQNSAPGALEAADVRDIRASRPLSAPTGGRPDLLRVSAPIPRSGCVTEPYPPPSSTEWPDPLDTSASAPAMPRLRRISLRSGTSAPAPKQLDGACSHGSSCALDALVASGSAASISSSPAYGSFPGPSNFGKQHGSSLALQLLASQDSVEGGSSSMAQPPTSRVSNDSAASSGSGPSSLSSRLRRGLSSDMSGWAPRLAGHFRTNSRGGGGGGSDDNEDADRPTATCAGSGRPPTGQQDEQLAAARAAPPPRAVSPAAAFASAAFGRPALSVAVGRPGGAPAGQTHPGAPPSAFAAGVRSPLAADAGELPRSSMSRASSADQGLEHHQRGSSAALEMLVGALSDDWSPSESPHAAAAAAAATSSRGRPRSPSPRRPPQRQPADAEQPRTVLSPKRGGSGRLTIRPRLHSSGAASKAGGGSSAGTSPLAAGMLGVSSSDSISGCGGGGGGGSGDSSTAGSADWSSRFGSLSAEYYTRPLDPITEAERTMKAGMRRGGSWSPNMLTGLLEGALGGHGSLDKPQQDQPGQSAEAADPAAAGDGSEGAAAAGAPSRGAAQLPQQQQPVPSDHRSGFGSLFTAAGASGDSAGWQPASLRDVASAGVVGTPHLESPRKTEPLLAPAPVDAATIAAMDEHRSAFGSVAWPEDAAAVAATARAARGSDSSSDGARGPFPEDQAALSGHSHSAPTAVKVVPRVGTRDDDSGMRTRFTSLPTHLDSITER